MEFNELAEKAYKDIKLSEYANLCEKFAYSQLKDLYYRFKIGELSKEKCIKLKNKLRKDYEDIIVYIKDSHEMYKHYIDNRNKNFQLLIDLEKTTDKDVMLKTALEIIANCIDDKSFVSRNLEKIK